MRVALGLRVEGLGLRVLRVSHTPTSRPEPLAVQIAQSRQQRQHVRSIPRRGAHRVWLAAVHVLQVQGNERREGHQLLDLAHGAYEVGLKGLRFRV